MSRFNEIKFGDRADLVHVVTADDVEKFVNLTGDDNKLHVDANYASHTTFKKPVVHGMLGASFISTIIGTKLPGDGALWFSQNLEFILPVRIGDKITVTVEVINKFERDKVIELQTDIFNQNQQKVTTGTARVKIVEQTITSVYIEPPAQKKVALIIGASGGIGSAICMRLAEDGYDIAMHCFNSPNVLKDLEMKIIGFGRRCHRYSANITEESEVEQMIAGVVRQFETISVLVNCATVKVINGKFRSLSWKEMQAHFDVNVKGAFNLAKYVLPLMQERKYGKLINFTTQYIEGTPPAELLAYVSAKSALSGFTKSLAVEYAPFGITINMISPGMTDTNLIADIPEKSRLMTAARTPLRRLAMPNDIAGAVSYLASEHANFVTGETIRINGGQLML
jgi:3-oxoacyl-[acyl-carrier protein] reductase